MTSDDGLAKDELADKVKKWLLSTGAPLEMGVARTLQLRALEVQQSVYFTDPDEDTIREIDVIGTRANRISDHLTVAAIAVVECKYAPTPWVLYRGAPAYDISRPNYLRIMTTYGDELLEAIAPHPAIHNGKLMQQEPRAGYALGTSNLKTPGTGDRLDGGKDLAYMALSSATKAARAYARTLDEDGERTTIAILFPIVVPRGRLFETWYGGEDLTVRELDRGQVLWNRVPGQAPDLVDVVTESAFERYSIEFRETADALVHEGSSAASKINTSGVY